MKRSIALLMLLAAVLAPTAAAKAPNPVVRVHGAWKIEVRTPAGQLVTRRVFHNDYVPTSALAKLLAGQESAGAWKVVLGRVAGSTPCRNSTCELTNAATSPGAASGGLFPGLQVTVSGNDLKLTGSFAAQITGRVGFVQSVLLFCADGVTAAACKATPIGQLTHFNFTNQTLGTPIPVSAGQQVAVDVTISFGP